MKITKKYFKDDFKIFSDRTFCHYGGYILSSDRYTLIVARDKANNEVNVFCNGKWIDKYHIRGGAEKDLRFILEHKPEWIEEKLK